MRTDQNYKDPSVGSAGRADKLFLFGAVTREPESFSGSEETVPTPLFLLLQPKLFTAVPRRLNAAKTTP